MERSGSQKFLLVISIIGIIGAVLGIILGALTIAGGGIIGATPSSQLTADQASALSSAGVTTGQAGAVVGVVGIVVLIASLIELITSILGVRAANDNQKIKPVWILSIIAVIGSIVGIISAVVQGSFGGQAPSLIVSVIWSLLMLWVANNIKQEAGL